jgi:hypothetical protein
MHADAFQGLLGGVSPQQCCPPLSAGTRTSNCTLYPQSHGASGARVPLHAQWHQSSAHSAGSSGAPPSDHIMHVRALQTRLMRSVFADVSYLLLIFGSENRAVCEAWATAPRTTCSRQASGDLEIKRPGTILMMTMGR